MSGSEYAHAHRPLPQFRLVVKTALKLLLVFVEYTETNAALLIKAVAAVDSKRGRRRDAVGTNEVIEVHQTQDYNPTHNRVWDPPPKSQSGC